MRTIRKQSAKQYEPVAEGANHWIVFAVNELGELPNFDNTANVLTLAIGFESVTDLQDDGTRRVLWKRVNATLHEKSTLGRIVTAAGMVVADGEDFEPSSLIGKNVTLIIGHEVKGDKRYARIEGYAKLAKGAQLEMPQHSPTQAMPAWIIPAVGNVPTAAVDVTAVATNTATGAVGETALTINDESNAPLF